VEEYHRMGEAGILHEDDRIELLDGQLYVMSPIGSEHAACVRRLDRIFQRRAEPEALVSAQNPVVLGEDSEPEPDLALLSPRDDDYAAHHPRPEDVLLLVEVADSTEAFDRSTKLSLYAQAGIPEYWVVSLSDGHVHVYRDPKGDHYESHSAYGVNDSVAVGPLTGTDPLPVSRILRRE
jgi:hypothetical protein